MKKTAVGKNCRENLKMLGKKIVAKKFKMDAGEQKLLHGWKKTWCSGTPGKTSAHENQSINLSTHRTFGSHSDNTFNTVPTPWLPFPAHAVQMMIAVQFKLEKKIWFLKKMSGYFSAETWYELCDTPTVA
jgi:hypothetical protein